jgi:V/A-type H+-transporting ATPase subunit B
MTGAGGLEYRGLSGLRGPLAFVQGVAGVAFHEHVEVIAPDGTAQAGRVLAVTGESAVIEVFGTTEGLTLDEARVRFHGTPLMFAVGREMLGRIYDGMGRPSDGLPPPLAAEERAIEGAPVNPVRREFPRDFLQTGISSIDALNSVVLGQKLPIFTEAGLPHDSLAMQIIAQAQAPGVERFAVVFAALGLPREIALRYEDAFRRSGARQRVVAFMNYADDPAAERLITPRCALTAAEYLAFDLGLHVLVVLNDMTNYGEALREVSAARGEVPSRKGYPGYLYSDLASIFERAGRILGGQGSLTQLPIVTMPSGDITHPIPDLTGYVTEGQIVLDRELDRRGIYPPVAILPSLSRLMNDGIGAGRTRDDHAHIARQLYASCARVARARSLESIIGREEQSDVARQYLEFGEAFEQRFLSQQPDEVRTIALTLDRALEILAVLPDRELGHLPARLLDTLRRRPAVASAAASESVA